MLDEEHAVSGRVLLEDDIILLEDFMLKLEENGVQEVDVSVLEHGYVVQQARTHHRQNLLYNTHTQSFSSDCLIIKLFHNKLDRQIPLLNTAVIT